RDSFDTICGATQERQDALEKLLAEPLDLLLVIGGYNSSNTSHLAEMGMARLPTYFIKNASKIVSAKVIHHYDLQQHREIETVNWLPPRPVTVGITAGASCPSNVIEQTIRRLFELHQIPEHCWLAAISTHSA
ncbi:MAG: 4-hydroxy-3-methylbut-2-enyl diphosphate reductase, partial [Verrucomicrobiae bacterium]|nr:4-hydroxy-3-methylbut-2-enyl diphosphate reductase [Verrucomicrobiae bacterium]